MPRHKKIDKSNLITRDEITVLCRNNVAMTRNYLDQRLAEALSSKDLPLQKGKSKQTIREYTMTYVNELLVHIDQDWILAEEVLLSLAAAQAIIHLTRGDVSRKLNVAKIAEDFWAI